MEEKGKDIREHILFNIVMFILIMVFAFLLVKFLDKHPYPETKIIIIPQTESKTEKDTVMVYKYVYKPCNNN